MHQATRIQNEVAIMKLASAALRDIHPPVVPRVFAWGAATPTTTTTAANINTSAGWILQEFMPGVALAEPFATAMSFTEKRRILSQMAILLKGLQDYPLPESVHG